MQKILLQLDTDVLPSTFDRIVAVDSGVDHVYSYGSARAEIIQGIIHGAIFTRGADELKDTAIFVGGSDLAAGEYIVSEIRKHLLPQFGLTVSVMLDSNGSNTTAAAAVLAAGKHLDLKTTTALVLGGTGPVGQRVARLLARGGAEVRIGSRDKIKAEAVALSIRNAVIGARVVSISTASATDGPAAVAGAQLVVACGAAGVVLLPRKIRLACPSLKVAIDLNAVPPTGIEGLEPTDKGIDRDGVVCYGALGIGGTKMKLHRAAVTQLFTRNDLVIDAEQVYELPIE